MRGVVMVRGRLVPLIHLGSLVGNQAPPVAPGPLMVVAESNGQWVALEVDEVGSAGAPDLIAAEQSGGLPGLSAGALRRDDTWIPVLNLEALARRWQEPAMKV
jgi:chemotaxis signal transduction protein